MDKTTVVEGMLAGTQVMVNKVGPWCAPGEEAHRVACRKCKDRYCVLARNKVKPCNVCQKGDCDRAWYGTYCSNRRQCPDCGSLWCDFALSGGPCDYDPRDHEPDGF